MDCSLLRILSRSIVRFSRAGSIRAAIPAQFELAGANHAEFVICNQSIEQDHGGIKRITRPMMGFKSFDAAQAILTGIELVRMLRKE